MGKRGGLNRKPDDRKHKTIEQWVAIAEELANENGGLLPYYTTLKAKGFEGLNYPLKKHPEIFAHIRQETIRSKQIALAEKLANENEGIVPHRRWLQENGYSNLIGYIMGHPEEFAHIPQEKSFSIWKPQPFPSAPGILEPLAAIPVTPRYSFLVLAAGYSGVIFTTDALSR